MMNKMMAKLQRFGIISKQLHTIISQETIKPSSPTPLHLKIHNLSLLDKFAPDMHTPIVFFYPNYKIGYTKILKKSLSKCLIQYYPFAGRLPTPPAPYINCNDKGVEFLEASNDSPMDYFIHKNKKDKNLDQLFPYGLSCSARASCPNLLEVQLNHFACGGVAVALSISHKLANAGTIINLIDHWATVTRSGSPKSPYFIPSSTTSTKIMVPKFDVNDKDKVNYATSVFVFHNSKLNELKKKVIGMEKAPPNPTRVEVLTSLIFKHAVTAAKTKSGSLEFSNLSIVVSLRKNFFAKNPERAVTAVGNFFTLAISKMMHSGEIKLDEVTGVLRKGKLELAGLSDEGEVVEKLINTFSKLHGDVYYSSSACRVPFYEVDFGWGKPVEVTVRVPDVEEKSILMMDTPSGDGIKAFVHLPEQEIAILQKDRVSYLC